MQPPESCVEGDIATFSCLDMLDKAFWWQLEGDIATTTDGSISMAPSSEGDIALEEPDVFYSFVSRMHLLGCVACLSLFVMHRAGVEAIEGWWIVCAPFFPSVLYSRWRYWQALRAKPHAKNE